MIGSFGDLVFVASSETLRTFQNFSRSTTARWGVHDIHLQNPKPQYIGPGQDSISMTMRFDIRYGMNPRSEMTRLLVLCRDGEAHTLVIGGLPMGASKWYIESITQTWERLDGKGNVIVGGAELTMKEYI